MKQKKPSKIIDPAQFGISFSLKQCKAFNIDMTETLQWLLDQGFRRFRLMSYWDEHEAEHGTYDFALLDKQIDIIGKAGGEITLCLGARQPRWPENHWPEWALLESKPERTKALLKYIRATVKQYKNNQSIVSYQLENEYFNHFGRNIEFDRRRLRNEYWLIKKLDKKRPIVMTTSNGWGIPLIGPIPDIVGFSYYTTMYQRGKYNKTIQKPWLHRFRKKLIHLIWNRPVFIHELQMEPWGPTAIWKMELEEQDKSMSVTKIAQNVELAKSVNVYPIDLWGAEWWYWRIKKHSDPSIWLAVKDAIESTD